MLRKVQLATKKASSARTNSHLLIDAKKLGINLCATLEQDVTQKVQIAKQDRWDRNNKDAIAFCNQEMEGNGLFFDKYRTFG